MTRTPFLVTKAGGKEKVKKKINLPHDGLVRLCQVDLFLCDILKFGQCFQPWVDSDARRIG